jgi:hypothetical protein
VQFPDKPPPPDIPVNDQASPPGLDSGPPHHDSRDYENDEEKSSETIDAAARISGEQIIVQFEELGNNADAERRRIAEIFSGIWIE